MSCKSPFSRWVKPHEPVRPKSSYFLVMPSSSVSNPVYGTTQQFQVCTLVSVPSESNAPYLTAVEYIAAVLSITSLLSHTSLLSNTSLLSYTEYITAVAHATAILHNSAVVYITAVVYVHYCCGVPYYCCAAQTGTRESSRGKRDIGLRQFLI